MSEMVSKVTLGTGKVVLLRNLQIKHQEQAAMAAAPRAGDSQMLLGIHMQKELLKLLLVQVNGATVSGAQVEDLDALFTFGEYAQLSEVMAKLAGSSAEMGKFQLEVVSTGGN